MNLLKYYPLFIGLQVLLAAYSISTAEEMDHIIEKGKNHVHGSHLECPLPKNREDIIDCALELHPSIRRVSLRLDVASKLHEKASQIPNPTFSSRFVKGDNNGEDVSELETNLSFTLELGGKRDSRKEYAIATRNEVLASSESIKSDVKVRTILNLYHLRQVLEEKVLLNEAWLLFPK